MTEIEEIFQSVSETMEQHPDEIRPFAEWLKLRQPHHVLEIGVRYGGTAALWHQLSTGCVIGVDWIYQDSLGPVDTRLLAETMQERYPRYRFVEGNSHLEETKRRVTALIPEFDFLFIDGDHSYDGVTQDWRMYAPLVRSGGCIAFHDIVNSQLIRQHRHGVYKLWREIVGKKFEFYASAGEQQWGGIGVVLV